MTPGRGLPDFREAPDRRTASAMGTADNKNAPKGMENMVDMDLTGLVLPEKAEAVHKSENGRIARFVVEPLERGYGHTLGNAVRRVLLSSLPGAAVWAFRADGVVHEHQTIPGVVEDVHQIIQNLKSLVVTLDDHHLLTEARERAEKEDGGAESVAKAVAQVPEVTLEIEADSAGAVRAGMIKDRPGVEVLDPDHHILTLQEDRPFRMELRVRKGRGFVLADQHPLEKGAPVDLVRIDAIFNPVRRANFEVSETRVGERTDFDQLMLHVETDGSISPEDAVTVASELVQKHLKYLQYFGRGGIPRRAPAGSIPVPESVLQLFEREVDDLGELSIRCRNSLSKVNIKNLGELVQRTEEQMLGIDNFGKKSLQEIQDFLGGLGLYFGMRIEEADDGRLYFLDGEAASRALESADGE
jgi:DNA-directed RNA polymerase subunit alpha